MGFDIDALDALRERVIGCAIEVHRRLGPGLLESIYRDALIIELRVAGLSTERERCIRLTYRDEAVGGALRIDIVVEQCLIIEVKSVESLLPVHSAQVMSYLKLSGLPCGLLINFNMTTLRAGVKRLSHPDLYAQECARHAGRPVGGAPARRVGIAEVRAGGSQGTHRQTVACDPSALTPASARSAAPPTSDGGNGAAGVVREVRHKKNPS